MANRNRGPYSPEEDAILKAYIEKHGHGNWSTLPQRAGLNRCGKSCRLRWMNYLRPDIKHGNFTAEEDKIISYLYSCIGSKWSIIAAELPGRTDNEVKNYWTTRNKRQRQHEPAPLMQLNSPSNPTADYSRYYAMQRNLTFLPSPTETPVPTVPTSYNTSLSNLESFSTSSNPFSVGFDRTPQPQPTSSSLGDIKFDNGTDYDFGIADHGMFFNRIEETEFCPGDDGFLWKDSGISTNPSLKAYYTLEDIDNLNVTSSSNTNLSDENMK
ncbi:hypothetical protein GIB67_037450 [Kingdonia uniflora]|uniref:Uncharacterized protein n=1 Tax=Kingdonia uniflora TaxID=39325 RepID=A0A7J7NID8_9MAGN|nr:hypothetical protein GIB67_037450 [Kingdonia uniflora]